MTRTLDCLVSYFGIDENERPNYRRYFCYQVVAGPGPTDEAGIAVVTTLATHRESERCTSCQKVHAVETGGPEAAIAAAVRYLDSYHEQDHLWKVQGDIRGLERGEAGTLAYPAEPISQRLARSLALPGWESTGSKGGDKREAG